MKYMATINDVAKRAGVSITTVSRAINNSGYVSEEARRKIDEAIRELNYIVNERARNLSRQRSGIIGVIIPDLENPFYGKLIKHIEIELYSYGYKTMVCNTIGTSNREKEYIDMLDRNIVDGIITCALVLEDQVYTRIKKPIVSTDHDFGPSIPLIHSDHKKGGRLAAERIIRAGCRNVVMVGARWDVKTPSSERYSEFERIMKENRIPLHTIYTDWNKMSYSYYTRIMKEYSDILMNADGIFTSDIGAIALYHLAAENGRKIPRDLKIIGYDGMDITRISKPVISCVKQDAAGLAKRCVSTIMKLIGGGEEIEYHQILDVVFQEGETINCN